MSERQPPKEPEPLDFEGVYSNRAARAMLGLVRAATLLESDLDAELRDADVRLRTSEWDTLVFIAAKGPIRPSELLRVTTLCVSPGTLHGILARLEERGLVLRSSHPEITRGVVFETSDEGRALLERHFPAFFRRVIIRFGAAYSDEELDLLDELTGRV